MTTFVIMLSIKCISQSQHEVCLASVEAFFCYSLVFLFCPCLMPPRVCRCWFVYLTNEFICLKKYLDWSSDFVSCRLGYRNRNCKEIKIRKKQRKRKKKSLEIYYFIQTFRNKSLEKHSKHQGRAKFQDAVS